MLGILRGGLSAVIEGIRKEVHDAAFGNQKIVIFHFQALKNAVALASVGPESFCRDIGVPESSLGATQDGFLSFNCFEHPNQLLRQHLKCLLCSLSENSA